ncbi:MAG: protein translocase subunit SecF [Spirochaetaceae bacterium]|jgi:preprotein translocase subunit SecF|nr:protein translocase subunit SecF [Spirochaetaceae bacterium]
MKRTIHFSKVFIPAAIISVVLIAFGITGYVLKGGFNLGVDFKAGLMQEIQFAPSAFTLTYSGKGNAVVSFSRTAMDVVISGPTIDNVDHSFSYTAYPTLQVLTDALRDQVDGLGVSLNVDGNVESSLLIQSAQGNPQLGASPFVMHYMPKNTSEIDIADVRDSLEEVGNASVQVLGSPSDRHFMIRMDQKNDAKQIPAEKIIEALEKSFGQDDVVVLGSNSVDSRFSKQLSDQAGLLVSLTLLLILIYASIRFKPQYAIGAVLAIMHDALIMIMFIVWTGMEFNTTTIAAILTILGYSINDTIVIFDRIREVRRLNPDLTFVDVLDKALTETLGRTIITTLTTMLAVVSLYVFTTGSMKDFALALLVGMISGIYSTIFIASAFVDFWEYHIKPRKLKKKKTLALEPGVSSL